MTLTKSKDADTIARVCVEAINGTVSLGPLELMKLKGSFSRYANNPELQNDTLTSFVDKLVDTDPCKAARIADLIFEKMGR